VIEDHHIFPRGHLAKTQHPLATQADSILNRTLIDGTTNRKISDRPPFDYLGEVRDVLAKENVNVEHMLRSHMIRGDAAAAIWANRF
jgi:hypothetical protein